MGGIGAANDAKKAMDAATAEIRKLLEASKSLTTWAKKLSEKFAINEATALNGTSADENENNLLNAVRTLLGGREDGRRPLFQPGSNEMPRQNYKSLFDLLQEALLLLLKGHFKNMGMPNGAAYAAACSMLKNPNQDPYSFSKPHDVYRDRESGIIYASSQAAATAYYAQQNNDIANKSGMHSYQTEYGLTESQAHVAQAFENSYKQQDQKNEPYNNFKRDEISSAVQKLGLTKENTTQNQLRPPGVLPISSSACELIKKEIWAARKAEQDLNGSRTNGVPSDFRPSPTRR